MNKNVEIIRAACIKANPSLETLHYGSRVRFIHPDDEELPTSKWLIIRTETETPYVVQAVDNLGRVERVSTLSPDFVFEPPIRLADVLLAIEEMQGEVEYSTFGELFHIGKYEKSGRNGYYSKGFWNLRKDDLTQQSEDTLALLADLLK